MPYLGEIRMFAGNFAPVGWELCQGQTVPISENDALFALIGTTYGGDGEETFRLPDLSSRLPIHWGQGPGGQNVVLGQNGGVEEVTLTVGQVAPHNHPVRGSAANATTTSPTGNVAATMIEVTTFAYGTDLPPTSLLGQSVGPVGGSQPHTNLQPFICINFIISMSGIFPSPT